MKKTYLIIALFPMWMSANAQHSTGSCFGSLGASGSYNAPGGNITEGSLTPDFGFGYKQPFDKIDWSFELLLRPLTGYSPATKDTSYAIGDSSKFTTEYKKSATVLILFGITSGREAGGFTCGAHTGFGMAFMEYKGKLTSSAIWDIGVKAGLNFSEKMAGFATCDYSYMWSEKQGLPSNGFVVLPGIMIILKTGGR
jgi:hypothetical protein